MRQTAPTIFALVLTASILTAQSAALPGDNTRIHNKGVTLSGQLSSDGKLFRADDDNDWTISNVDAIKGLEGRYITVTCRMNPEKRTIRILFVAEQPATRHAVNLGDPAFRR